MNQLTIYPSSGRVQITPTPTLRATNDSFDIIDRDMLNEIFSWLALRDTLSVRATCQHWKKCTQVIVVKQLCIESQKQLHTVFLLAFISDIHLGPQSTCDQSAISDILKAFKAKKADLKKNHQSLASPPEFSKQGHYDNFFEYYYLVKEAAKHLFENRDLDLIAEQLEIRSDEFNKHLKENLSSRDLEFLKNNIQENALKKKAITTLKAQENPASLYTEIKQFFGNTLSKILKGIVQNIDALAEQYHKLSTPENEEKLHLETVGKVILTAHVLMPKESFILLYNAPSPIQKSGALLSSHGNLPNVNFAFPLGITLLVGCSLNISLVDSDNKIVSSGLLRSAAHLQLQNFFMTFPNLILNPRYKGEGYKVLFSFGDRQANVFKNVYSEPFTIEEADEKSHIEEIDESTPIDDPQALDGQEEDDVSEGEESSEE